MKAWMVPKRLGVRFSLLFMRVDGAGRSRIEQGTLCSVVDRTFILGQVLDALSYVRAGRSRGKVVETMADTR